MIAMLKGRLASFANNRGILDVRDVGYEVYAPARTLDVWARAEDPVSVFVSTQVREDSITLYGFSTDADRIGFQTLLSVSGVGPKLALACLDTMSVDELRRAVETEDVKALTRIAGIGKRTAQRIALELRGKLAVSPLSPSDHLQVQHRPSAEADTLEIALSRLGYNKAEITMVQQELPRQGVNPDDDISARLKAALRILYARR